MPHSLTAAKLSIVFLAVAQPIPSTEPTTRPASDEHVEQAAGPPSVTGVVSKIDGAFGLKVEIDGDAGTALLISDDYAHLKDRITAESGSLRIRVTGRLEDVDKLGEIEKLLLGDEHRREGALVMYAEDWHEISKPFAAEPAELPPPFIRMFPWWKTFTVAQRSDEALPGSDGRVRLETGDVTGGQVSVRITADHNTLLLDTVSLRPDDVVTFEIEGQTCHLRLVRLHNYLIHMDFATFRLVIEPVPQDQPTTQRQEESQNGPAGTR